MREDHWTVTSLPELTHTGTVPEEPGEPSTSSYDRLPGIHPVTRDDSEYTVPDTGEMEQLPSRDDEATRVSGAGNDAWELAAAADLLMMHRSPPPAQKDEGAATPFDDDRLALTKTQPGDLLHLAFGKTSQIQLDQTAVVAGRYRIEEAIGEGGMGSVFRATHLRLGKDFALKRMHGGLSGDPYLRDLFYREARLASSLSHPNIVSVVDYGEDRNLGAFMVMELVSGTPPNSAGKGKSVSLRKALDVLLQIAEALHYSHSKGVIHSDVKPDNILVAETAGAAQRGLVAKLVDFGLANLDSATQKPRDGVRGTPQYLAPERILGAPPDPKMDIYGLGVVAYELITGKLPFSQFRKAHPNLHAKPAPLVTSSGKVVDERVNLMVQRMLQKRPEDRHKDMGAVIFEMRTAMQMLGFSKRTRRSGRPTNELRAGMSERARQSLRAFELFPLPGALLTEKGVILAANNAMVGFLGRGQRVEGQGMGDSMLLGIYPQFREDLHYVTRTNRGYTRRLLVTRTGAPDLELFVHLSPGEKGLSEVVMVVMTAPRASG